MRFIPIDYKNDEGARYGRFEAEFDDLTMIQGCNEGDQVAFYTGALVKAQAVLDANFFFNKFAYFSKKRCSDINMRKLQDDIYRITVGQFEDELVEAGEMRKCYGLPEYSKEIGIAEITQERLRKAYQEMDIQDLVNTHFSFAAHSFIMRRNPNWGSKPVINGGSYGPDKVSKANLKLI